MKLLFIAVILGGIIFALSRKKRNGAKPVVGGTPYTSQENTNPADSSTIIPN